ncbi:hypothetical protein HDU81_005635 [Chytriomyces hyalinus]|nr:hypothetical protein HDU81_005635 [Chytriomyces hyalinus]
MVAWGRVPDLLRPASAENPTPPPPNTSANKNYPQFTALRDRKQRIINCREAMDTYLFEELDAFIAGPVSKEFHQTSSTADHTLSTSLLETSTAATKLTPVSSLANSPNNSNNAKILLDFDVDSVSSFDATNLKESMRHCGWLDSAEQWPYQSGIMYGSLLAIDGDVDPWCIYSQKMLSQHGEDAYSTRDGSSSTSSYQGLERSGPQQAILGGKPSGEDIVNQGIAASFSALNGPALTPLRQSASDSTSSLETLVDAAVALSTTDNNAYASTPNQPIISKATYIPLNQIRFSDQESCFTYIPVSTHFPQQAYRPHFVPEFSAPPPPPTIHPSAIYFQPQIHAQLPIAAASAPILTPFESPERIVMAGMSNPETRFHPYERPSSVTSVSSDTDKKRLAAEKMAAATQKALFYSLSMENQTAASAAEGSNLRKRRAQIKREQKRSMELGGYVSSRDVQGVEGARLPGMFRDIVSAGPGEAVSDDPSITQQRKCRPNHRPNVTALLFKWLMEHQHNPYPSEDDKKSMSADTGLTYNQVNDWFINARRRYL